MPLDTAEHVWAAWRMIGHPSIRGHLRQFDGYTPDEITAVLEVMRRRIRRAAWEHNILLNRL
jgi:hypothetical protein